MILRWYLKIKSLHLLYLTYIIFWALSTCTVNVLTEPLLNWKNKVITIIVHQQSLVEWKSMKHIQKRIRRLSDPLICFTKSKICQQITTSKWIKPNYMLSGSKMIYIKFHFLSGFSLKALGFCTKKNWLKIGLIFGYKSYSKSSWSAVSSGFSTDHHEALRSCLPHRLQVTSVIIFIKLTQGCTRSLFTNHQI